ncbi:hypothetical protein PF011_g29624 [Phytophthora fragariae]|uniref:Uncharacterized protein n=1 Tax=Phytophthora fragariae TaxID=53985 RepID=A0A6A3GYF7_9STRA|nr:hypothetical protein PF011_g29624 [Phytophthora fragariae]
MLTIWKYAAKVFAVRMTRQVEDFIPELVAFSVDFFGSLFISVCMSSSNSFYLTALFLGTDVVHLLVKFREISSHEKKILQMLHNRRQTESSTSGQLSEETDLVTMIVRAVQDPKTYRLGSLDEVRIWAEPPHLISEQAYTHLQDLEASGKFGHRIQSTSTRTIFAVASRHPFSCWMFRRTSVVPAHIVPTPTHTQNSNGAKGTESLRQNTQSGHLVLNGLQLLFDFEYLMLVEYIECVVPFVYLAYKSVLEQLPNIVYYPGGVGKWGTTAVTNLLVFAVLEVGSLVLVHLFLRHKFAFSPLHQLAFVLETQFHTIQASLFSLMLFTLQYQLAHLGVDFSFRFDWLRR